MVAPRLSVQGFEFPRGRRIDARLAGLRTTSVVPPRTACGSDRRGRAASSALRSASDGDGDVRISPAIPGTAHLP